VTTEYFKHGKRLVMKSEQAVRTFLSYVALRVFPHPSESTTAAISVAVDRMAKKPVQGLRVDQSTRNGRPVAVMTADKKTLNRLANEIAALAKSPTASDTIRAVRFSGPPQKDQPFLAKNLGVSPGSPVSNAALSDNLYAISQLPGYARADALLVPTGTPGTDDLVVKTTPSAKLAGSQIEVDNYGYAPTGAVTLNGTLDINDSLFTGDELSVLASTSFFGMNSGTLAYSAPTDLSNRLGVDMNALTYRLGLGFSPWGHGATVSQLVALGLSGSNYSFDGWEMHSFVKTPTAQAFVKGTLFLKEFQDTYSATVQNDRSVLGGTLELSGSKTAGRLSGNFDLADTEYDLSQGSGSSPQNPFYSDTQGIQNYWTGNGGIRYALTPVYAVYLSTVDQQYIGGGVLDPMLQAVLGGMSNVRVLPTAALFGNNLYSGSLNFLRTDAAYGGSLVSSAFFDVGQVTGIGFQYSAMGPGVEEAWTGTHLFGKIDLAVPVGPLPTGALGPQITALTGGNIQDGGIPLQLWMSLGWRY
jgi:hemolysin activation/secretion protein